MQCVCECTRKSEPLSDKGLGGPATLTARFFINSLARFAKGISLADPRRHGAAGLGGSGADLPDELPAHPLRVSVRGKAHEFSVAVLSSKRIRVGRGMGSASVPSVSSGRRMGSPPSRCAGCARCARNGSRVPRATPGAAADEAGFTLPPHCAPSTPACWSCAPRPRLRCRAPDA